MASQREDDDVSGRDARPGVRRHTRPHCGQHWALRGSIEVGLRTLRVSCKYCSYNKTIALTPHRGSGRGRLLPRPQSPGVGGHHPRSADMIYGLWSISSHNP